MNRRIAVLTSKVTAEVPQRLLEEAQSVGIPLDIIWIKSSDWVQQLNKQDYSYVVTRLGPESYHVYEASLGRINHKYRAMILHAMKAFNKAESYELIYQAGLPQPKTTIMKPGDLASVPAPFVVKKLLGHQGRGVYLVENETQATATIEELAHDPMVVVQEFIKHANARHKRLFVVGDKVISSMTRTGPAGEFKSNAKGNVGEVYEPTREECLLAIDAAKAHGLVYAGVDLIDSEAGPLVLETNPSPGLTIESYTGVNIARKIIDALA